MSQPKIKMLVGDGSKVVRGQFADAVAKWPKPITILSAFIDVAMPEMNGMEAVARLRYGGGRTFITVMSCTGGETRFQLACHLSTYEFLVRPFWPGDVRRILQIHQRVSLPTRVVIVDDSATVRGMVKKILAVSIFNIMVAKANSGEDMLMQCACGGFDIVFLDCNMPGPRRPAQTQSGYRSHHDVRRAQ